MIVVDTNIIAHFWLPSDHSGIVDQLFQMDPEWVAPILWRSEFRNVVSLYFRKDLLSLSDAFNLTEKAEMQMKDREFHVNSVRVYQYMSQSECSSYDCEFVSLAGNLNIKLVTMDNQILESFPELTAPPSEMIE